MRQGADRQRIAEQREKQPERSGVQHAEIGLQEWHRRIPEYHIPDDVELQYAAVPRQVEHLPLVFDKVLG